MIVHVYVYVYVYVYVHVHLHPGCGSRARDRLSQHILSLLDGVLDAVQIQRRYVLRQRFLPSGGSHRGGSKHILCQPRQVRLQA